MAAMMKAAVVRSFHEPLTIEEVALPTPGPGQVLIRVVASGVCHTDLHAADGDWPVRPTLPFIPGHEGAGYVAALGPGVTAVKDGDRVGVPWLHSACGTCEHCLTGWETLCPQQQNSGYSVDGGYAEYVLAAANYVARIPDALSFVDAAPILCAGVTTYKGLKETDTRPGDWVVISGIGGLGHVAVQYAIAMGLHVAAVDIADEKLVLARDLGAELVVNATTTDPVAVIQQEIGGAHGALITAVSVPAFRQGIGMLRRGGTCALVGLPPGDFPTPIFDVVLKRLTIRGSIVGTRQDLHEALEFAAQRKVQATTEIQPLEAINAVFDRLRAGAVQGRVVLGLEKLATGASTT
jgi:propanol-preferring alcohol dehydrogenase